MAEVRLVAFSIVASIITSVCVVLVARPLRRRAAVNRPVAAESSVSAPRLEWLAQ